MFEWVKKEGNIAIIGIFAKVIKEIGKIENIRFLKKVNDYVKKKEEVVVLETVKSAIDICCPLKGKVVEINKDLEKNLDLLNRDPEGLGWILKIEVA